MQKHSQSHLIICGELRFGSSVHKFSYVSVKQIQILAVAWTDKITGSNPDANESMLLVNSE